MMCGFENLMPLEGGIQTTGNYPGKARTIGELRSDLDLLFPAPAALLQYSCQQLT
jgi:L-rhamnose isomerase